MTAREAAKQLIRYEVLNGWTIDQLAKSYSGVCGSDYKVQIGGYMWRDADLEKSGGKPFKHLNNYQIGVERVGKVEVMEIFSLKEIYNEIVLEKQTGRKEQLTLF